MKIIILPGIDGTGKLLKEFGEEISTDHEPVIVSYPDNLVSYDDLYVWISKKLPKKENYVLVAESFSGPIAILVAAQGPSNLKGVAFVATFARSPRRVPEFFTTLVRVIPIKSKFLAYISQPLTMGRWASMMFVRQFNLAMQAVSNNTISERLRQVLRVDNGEAVTAISVPMLYLRASQDLLVPMSAATDFIGGSTIFKSVKGPHFLLQAKPRECAQLISSFADRPNPHPQLSN